MNINPAIKIHPMLRATANTLRKEGWFRGDEATAKKPPPAISHIMHPYVCTVWDF